MKTQFLTASVIVVMLSGCSGTSDVRAGIPNVRLYPIEGPLAAANPGQVIRGKTVATGSNDGHLSFTLPDGATCSGRWAVTKNKLDAKGEAVESIGDMTGTGHPVKHFVSRGEGAGSCANGATFEVAFAANGNSGLGVVRDSNGNIYKLGYGPGDYGKP